MKLFKNLIIGLFIGIFFYWIAIQSIVLWTMVAVVCPFLLILVHFFIRPIFLDIFTKRKMIVTKYVTFIFQNMLLIVFYLYFPDYWFGVLAIWILRINLIEVFFDLYHHKQYAYCFTTILFLFTVSLEFAKDATYIVVLKGDPTIFIIEYTIWFTAWISTCVKPRFNSVIHAFMPLLLPPALWYSARTLTGMVALQFAYIPKTNFIVNTNEKVVGKFAEIYKPIYLIATLVLYAYKIFYLV